MPAQVISSVENNFTKGLITEFTGLNFPENAATDADNCTFTLIGDVTRREGIDFETNFNSNILPATGNAISSYKWNNAGGDGSTQLYVAQFGTTLRFYSVTSATTASPLSNQLLATTVDITQFATGLTPDPSTQECQYADGNGYLFVYHPSCDPFFCSFTTGAITATKITVNIRDFTGVMEPGVDVAFRPNTLTNEHLYNLTNQGWTQGSPWSALTVGSGSPAVISAGSINFTVPAGITGVTLGDQVGLATATTTFPGGIPLAAGTIVMAGVVTSYIGTSMIINITGSLASTVGQLLAPYNITPINHGYINTWLAAVGNYPSNADVWWYFKDSAGNFNPSARVSQVTLNSGNAPRGHFIISAFLQDRSLTSAITSLTTVTTSIRPRTGTWFQGRVWYAGVDASQPKQGDADFYTWTSKIYFSQTVTDPSQFGQCYQLNDPTSETLFSLLPTDGGVISIPESGPIYKLFPLQNALIIFAANGVWYLTGSSGIGFTANDYTIVKLSSVQSISSTSFVDVQGVPYFWNEEGIYAVEPAKQGTSLLNSPLHVNPLEVVPITIGTILSFYNSIPLSSKKYVRGAYHPIDYVIQWVYNGAEAVGLTDRYSFDKILNFNTSNKAFFPYSVDTTNASIISIGYVAGPGGGTSPDPAFKYLTSSGSNVTFSDEHDINYVDWASSSLGAVNYNSFFVTGYKVHGQGQKRFQLPYIYIFSRANTATAYKIQSIWDYANSALAGKWSSIQRIYNNKPYFGMIFRRHRLRGQGIVLQIKVMSVDGLPFDVMGWSTYETLNQGI